MRSLKRRLQESGQPLRFRPFQDDVGTDQRFGEENVTESPPEAPPKASGLRRDDRNRECAVYVGIRLYQDAVVRRSAVAEQILIDHKLTKASGSTPIWSSGSTHIGAKACRQETAPASCFHQRRGTSASITIRVTARSWRSRLYELTMRGRSVLAPDLHVFVSDKSQPVTVLDIDRCRLAQGSEHPCSEQGIRNRLVTLAIGPWPTLGIDIPLGAGYAPSRPVMRH
jgi:hypothetical protein